MKKIALTLLLLSGVATIAIAGSNESGNESKDQACKERSMNEAGSNEHGAASGKGEAGEGNHQNDGDKEGSGHDVDPAGSTETKGHDADGSDGDARSENGAADFDNCKAEKR